MKPWQVFSGLTLDRLQRVASAIRHARHSAVTLFEPEMGDDAWSLGCRAYARTRFAITKAAEENPWLEIIEPGLHFVFAIGKLPLRFYHGDTESPPGRSLRQGFPEIQAQQLAFEFAKTPLIEGVFRLAVETDERGEATTVTLVLVDQNGKPSDSWLIPEMGEVVPLYEPKPSVDVGPPPVQVRRDVISEQE